jgi:PAS domain S-box-containing protein
MGFFGNLRDFLGMLALENNFLVLVCPDGRVIAGNSRYGARFGLNDCADPLARRFDRLGPKDFQNIKSQLSTEAPFIEVQSQESLTGYQVWVEWHCYGFTFEGRKYKLRVGSDVSEREYLKQKLQEIGSVAKIGYWRVDTGNKEVYWSPEVYNIHNQSRDTFIPDLLTLRKLYSDENWKIIGDSMNDCIGKGKPFSIKLAVVCDNDVMKHIQMEGSPEFNRSGRIIAISGTFRDRTHEVLTESRFSDTHEELRRAQDITKHLENTLDEHALVSIADVSGKIIYVNQKFCDVSGYTAEELIGQNHRLLKSGEHDPEFYAELWGTISSGRVWRGEICNLSKAGELYWVSSTIVPFVDSRTGKPIHYVSVRTDITELKEFQSRQDELLQKTLELSQTKSDFLANMSHELRTPLNAILGYSEMLQEQYFGKIGHDKYLEYSKYIHSSGERLLSLINDVLDISKIEAGRYEVSPAYTDMERILDDVFHEFIPMAAAARVKLQIDNSDRIGRVFVDEKAVKQIMANLLSNAIKFSAPEGDVTLTVWSDGCDAMAIEVRDTGIGMSKRDMEIALSPFGQVQSAQVKSYQGTGLGLPLCKHLAQLHGGEFSMKSVLGEGTSILIRLPMNEAAEGTRAAAG